MKTILVPVRRANGRPSDLIERILLDCGHAVLIAPAEPRTNLTGTTLVCWKETAESARSVTAALPLLENSKRVVIASVEEKRAALSGAFEVARQLRSHGIDPEATSEPSETQPASEVLQAIARRYGADLMVMGDTALAERAKSSSAAVRNCS